MNVDSAKLRKFINDKFGPQDLNDLLFDYFRSVHDDVTTGMTKRQQISLLLEFCYQHNQMPQLLRAVEDMRPFFQPEDYVEGQKAPFAAQPATFGTLLNYYRRQANDPVHRGSLTQARLADLLAEEGFNHSSAMIGKWEQDRTTISIDNRLTLIEE